MDACSYLKLLEPQSPLSNAQYNPTLAKGWLRIWFSIFKSSAPRDMPKLYELSLGSSYELHKGNFDSNLYFFWLQGRTI